MEQHTKEPWKAEQTGVYGNDGHAVLYAACGDALRASSNANARRIVACVNACAAFSIGQLEEGQVMGIIGELRQQRDELLAALEGVEKRCAHHGFVGMDGQYLKEIRAAIARVKGGA